MLDQTIVMEGSRLKPPRPEELAKVLKEKVSLTGVASHYRISYTTAKKCVVKAGLLESLSSPERQVKLKELIQGAPLRAKRLRIERELSRRLSDVGDRKLLARAIVDEFNLRYTFGRSGYRKRHILWLKVMMSDWPPVEQVAHLMGVKCKLCYRKAKSGVEVPYWRAEVNGYRAYKILTMVKSFLVGQKAFQADIALRFGPLTDAKVPHGKAEYKKFLFSQLQNLGKKVPASRLPDSSRKSVAPGRRAV